MAAKTIGDLVTESRYILQDTVDPFRYTDTSLYLILNTCFGEVRRIRPDLFFGLGYDQPLPSFTPADSGSVFPLSEMWYFPFVAYVAGSTELRDDEFTVDGRANALLSGFLLKLKSVA